MKALSPKTKGPKIHMVVLCNHDWFDEHGFMTKLPRVNGSYLGSLDIRPNVTHAIGNQLVVEPRQSASNKATGLIDEVMYRFAIEKNRIIHELPRDRRAIINPTKIVVEDHQQRMIEAWHPFLNDEKERVWRRMSVVKPVWTKHTASLVPSTMAYLYEEVTHVLDKCMRSLGFSERMNSDDDTATEELEWIWKPTHAVVDSNYYDGVRAAWHSRIPTHRQCEAWTELMRIRNVINNASRKVRTSPRHIDVWTTQLEAVSREFLEALDQYLTKNSQYRLMVSDE